jgi:PAS domain S-box-containing protein
VTREAGQSKLRVLVVDDDVDSREVTAAFLRASGFDVIEYESAEPALRGAAHVDAVLTDITLPGMNGYELARALRESEPTKHVVIFALSGRSDASPEQAKLFDRIVTKPFDPDALVRGLQETTGRTVEAPPMPCAAGSHGLSASEYRMLVEHAPTLVWRAGEDGSCNYVNETWLEFTGRKLDQELGAGWIENVHPDDAARCQATFQAHLAQRQPFEMEYRMRRHDGVYRTLLVRGIPLVEKGRFCGFLGSCIDVEERANTDRAKATFLGMMAHEMRTPLTPLRAYQVQMQRAQAKGEPISEELVKKLGRQIDRIAGLVEHLGDAARLSMNRGLSLAQDRHDFTALVRRVTDQHQAALAARRDIRHTPTLEVSGLERERPVFGDKKRLEQLAYALVENAVKFSPLGGTIHVSLETKNGEHLLSVDDEGIGIPREELGSIGRPYYRASNAPTENYPGLGLGLAVAKEIAGAHGGSLSIESGRGVRVCVRLPQAGDTA